MTLRPVGVAFDVLKNDAADRLAVADFMAMYPINLKTQFTPRNGENGGEDKYLRAGVSSPYG